MEIAVFRNTHVKAGVRLAGVTLGIAAVGLLGAPTASAHPTPETSQVIVENSVSGATAGLLNSVLELVDELVDTVVYVTDPTVKVVDAALSASNG
jgi:hypothetical protein